MSVVEKKRAFTLVELLVVIGIIAVLISVLLPALGRAREQANQAACLSNLRQVSMAFVMYANENKGWLPATARGGSTGTPGWRYAPNWIAYMPTENLDQSAIAKYLGKIIDNGLNNQQANWEKSMNVKVLRCPSDDYNTPRIRAMPPPIGNNNASAQVYKYSYVLNHYIGAGFLFVEYQKSVAMNQPPFVDTFSNAKGVEAVGKITQIRHPAEKMMLYEEAEATIDDGHASPDLINSTGAALNLLAIRHDNKRINAEPTGAGFFCTTTD